MTPLQQHLAERPEMPRPFEPDSALGIAWHRAFTWWARKKEELEIAERCAGIVIEQGVREKACTPRADYEWRDIPKRKRAPKPAWSGATREYNRQKQAERRARVRAAVLEVQAERDGAA